MFKTSLASILILISTFANPLSAANSSASILAGIIGKLNQAAQPPKKTWLWLNKTADPNTLITAATAKLIDYIQTKIRKPKNPTKLLSRLTNKDFREALEEVWKASSSCNPTIDLKPNYENLRDFARNLKTTADTTQQKSLDDFITFMEREFGLTPPERTRVETTTPAPAQTPIRQTTMSHISSNSTQGLSSSSNNSSRATTPNGSSPTNTTPPHDAHQQLQFDNQQASPTANPNAAVRAAAEGEAVHTPNKKSNQDNSSISPEIQHYSPLGNCSILSVIALTGGATLPWISSSQAKLAKQIIRNHQEIVASWNGLPTTMKIGRLGLSRSESSTLNKILAKYKKSLSPSWQPTNKMTPCRSNTIQKMLKTQIQAYRRQAILNTAVSAGAIAVLAAAGWSFATTAIAKS